jgi:two-component sensor histidine kinase
MDWVNSQTLGFRLMRALARQLSGELDIRLARGTEVRLQFPVPAE